MKVFYHLKKHLASLSGVKDISICDKIKYKCYKIKTESFNWHNNLGMTDFYGKILHIKHNLLIGTESWDHKACAIYDKNEHC